MWINKIEYEELLRSRNHWHELYNQSICIRDVLTTRCDHEITLNKELCLENAELKNQIEEYKQKYADEIQKRLELVKLLENTP